jgi:hypothetical protein
MFTNEVGEHSHFDIAIQAASLPRACRAFPYSGRQTIAYSRDVMGNTIFEFFK